MQNQTEGRKGAPVYKGLTLIAVVLGVLLLLGGASVALALTDPYEGRIVEGVTIGGLEVGGMTRGGAKKALKAAAEETLLAQPLEVELPKGTLTMGPKDTKVDLSISKAVKEAYGYGRNGSKEEKQAAAEKAGKEGYDVSLRPYLSWNETYIVSALKNYAIQYDTSLAQPKTQLQGEIPKLGTKEYDGEAPCPAILLTMGVPELRLDVDGIYEQILTAFDQSLSWGKDSQPRITPEVLPQEEPAAPDLTAIYQQYAVEAENDSLDMETYQLVSGSYGCIFDMAAAEELVRNAGYGETVTIPMSYQTPEILGEGVYFRDVLGSCDTKHNEDENRNTNLRLVCQILDGLVIQPGETFSYNGSVGERTPERGFKPAPAYSGKRLIQDYGGGVCQGSTTLYNCLLLADMEITERHCHGALVSYVPRGLDAAVNWATKTDLCFRNNSHFPVMIKAEVSDGYMKMQLLGTDEKDYYIKMESSSSEEEKVVYAVSYKCKYDKATDERLSRDLEVRSTYYKNLG